MLKYKDLLIGMLMGVLATLSGVFLVLSIGTTANVGSEVSGKEEATPAANQPDEASSTIPLAKRTESQTPTDAGNQYFTSVEEVRDAETEASQKPTAESYSDILQRIELSDFPEPELKEVETLETDLVTKLRERVKVELDVSYRGALSASDYKEGSRHLMEAAGTLALYPMSDDTETVREAESLSSRHNEMRSRLEFIRRARYNSWAASTIEAVMKVLRAQEDGYREASLKLLAVVEPYLLESSTSALYGYAIEQLMEEYSDSEKASVAKALNDPSTERRTLEAF